MGQCSAIGALPRARSLAARLDALAPQLGDDPRVAGALASGRGMLAFMTGELGAHRVQRALALAAFERAGNVRASCHERCWLAVALLELGLHAEARALLELALAEAVREYKRGFNAAQLRRWLCQAIQERPQHRGAALPGFFPACQLIGHGKERAVVFDVASLTAADRQDYQLDELDRHLAR